MSGAGKAHAACELLGGSRAGDVFWLDFAWDCARRPVRAGQFFMVRPKRSGVFLGRPLSAAGWRLAGSGAPGSVGFAVALRGKGTRELAEMRPGDVAELVGPLGNAWEDFLPDATSAGGKPVALAGGGIGVAPLAALLRPGAAPEGLSFELHAGFRTEAQGALLLDGLALAGGSGVAVSTEDGSAGRKGRAVDFLEPERYCAVCVCGPEPMMEAVARKCAAAGVPCYASVERRMACGVGACLGCTVKTAGGNRRCCADGAIFDARDVWFDGWR